MGNSAYQLSKRMLAPYKGQEALAEDNKEFNCHFSATHIVIEHVMGLLKSHWSCLR
ncbi:hypothetical protein HK096_010314, partial [Nowakowskiella sp. JEL0078]